jgi:hydroxymethylpyrimidine pyrophosphatase-like HAD family hydrolase
MWWADGDCHAKIKGQFRILGVVGMKRIVFDVEGTLSFNGQVMAAEIVAALQRLLALGHQIIFTSTRPLRHLLALMPTFHDAPLIGANGALVVKAGKIEVLAPIVPADLRRLRGIIAQANLDYVVDGQWNYAAQMATAHPLLDQLDPKRLAHRVPLAEITTAVKVTLLGLTATQTTDLAAGLRAHQTLAVSSAAEGNLAITAQHSHQATALRHLGVTDYIAFGNDQTDPALLAGARHSVWVTSKPQLAHLAPTATVVTCAPDNRAVAAQIARLAE